MKKIFYCALLVANLFAQDSDPSSDEEQKPISPRGEFRIMALAFDASIGVRTVSTENPFNFFMEFYKESSLAAQRRMNREIKDVREENEIIINQTQYNIEILQKKLDKALSIQKILDKQFATPYNKFDLPVAKIHLHESNE